MADYSGLSFQTQKGLMELDRQTSVPDALRKTFGVAGTPRRPGQTTSHPRTGEPLTQKESEALVKALRDRKVSAPVE